MTGKQELIPRLGLPTSSADGVTLICWHTPSTALRTILGNNHRQRPEDENGRSQRQLEIPPGAVLEFLCVQRQAAAVGVLLRFFRLCILALEVGECHVQRLVSEADSDRPYVPDCQQSGSRPAMTTSPFLDRFRLADNSPWSISVAVGDCLPWARTCSLISVSRISLFSLPSCQLPRLYSSRGRGPHSSGSAEARNRSKL
jgi:hypothetical protein